MVPQYENILVPRTADRPGIQVHVSINLRRTRALHLCGKRTPTHTMTQSQMKIEQELKKVNDVPKQAK